jgi:hypothetical protein
MIVRDLDTGKLRSAAAEDMARLKAEERGGIPYRATAALAARHQAAGVMVVGGL